MGSTTHSEQPKSFEDMAEAEEKDIQKEIAKNEGELASVQDNISEILNKLEINYPIKGDEALRIINDELKKLQNKDASILNFIEFANLVLQSEMKKDEK